MSRGLPSMTALLGLLAIAGYQNRDKIAEMLGGLGQTKPDGTSPPGVPTSLPDPVPAQPGGAGGLGGLLGSLTGALGGASAGSVLSGGLGELMDQFKQNGHGDTAQSWIGHGPNQEIAPQEVQQAIGPDVLATLARQTGLTPDEILARLSKVLPTAVDKYSPQGRLPSVDDFFKT